MIKGEQAVMSSSVLPNFFIVGAAKSGTSSLHHYLRQHSEIFMPLYIDRNGKSKKVKEPRFFVKDLVKDRVHDGVWSWEEYVSLFEGAETYKAIGESTVLYLYHYQEAIKNIKKHVGDHVRIIIMLRNPIDRAVSAYLHTRRGGFVETLPFEEALKVEEDRYSNSSKTSPMTLYKQMGLYHDMVKAFKESFDNVHIIIYDDFKNDTEKEVRKVFEFLGVDTNVEVDTSKRVNVGGTELNPLVKKVIYGNNRLKNLFGSSALSAKMKNATKKVLIKVGSKKEEFELNPETRKKLITFFSNDIQNLSKLIGRDLTFWIQ